MSKTFSMELLISGIVHGSSTTRARHFHQAKNIQAAILERWQLENPWKWKEKHLKWFLNSYLRNRKAVTVYSYYLTSRYIVMRMGRPWRLDNPSLGISRRADTSEG